MEEKKDTSSRSTCRIKRNCVQDAKTIHPLIDRQSSRFELISERKDQIGLRAPSLVCFTWRAEKVDIRWNSSGNTSAIDTLTILSSDKLSLWKPVWKHRLYSRLCAAEHAANTPSNNHHPIFFAHSEERHGHCHSSPATQDDWFPTEIVRSNCPGYY